MISVLSGIDNAASALNAERLRMDVIGQNIANSQVTRGLDGRPYQRQRVVFETVLRSAQDRQAGLDGASGVRVSRVETDPRPGRLIYHPGHPDADANGMVTMPGVNIHEEMVDMIAASRAFEANLMVVKTARSMAMQTLGLGKR